MKSVSGERVLALIGDIYASTVDHRRWRSTLQRTAEIFQASRSGLVVSAPTSGAIVVTTGDSDSGMMAGYSAYYGRIDPIAAAVMRAPAGAVLTNTDIISRAQMRRHEFFNDWAFPNACCDSISIRLQDDAEQMSWLCISSSDASRTFGTSQRRDLARLLAPHFQRAMQVQMQLNGFANKNHQLESAFDLLQHGLVIAARDGQVRFANAAAIKLLRTGDGISTRHGRLHVARLQDEARLQHLLHLAIPRDRKTALGGSMTVARSSGRRAHVVHVVPLQSRDSNSLTAEPAALILIVEPEQPLKLPVQIWQDLYGLTNAETRVASALLCNTGLQSVADDLQISLSTVRIHLQRVFEKTATRRQAELVRLLLTTGRGAETFRSGDEP